MKKSVLVLAAASLALNIALGYLLLRSRTSAPATAAAPAHSASPPAARAAPPAATSAALAGRLSEAQTLTDLRSVAGELRGLGLPESLVRSVIQAMVGEEFARRGRQIVDFSAVPYWKNISMTTEQQRAMRALEKERRALLTELGIPVSDVALRQRQFGNLSDAKIAGLEKIRQDYNELRQEMYDQARDNPQAARNLIAQQNLLNEEMQRDLDALLTPQEKLEYELRSSETSAVLRGQLRNTEVNEEEFRELFAVQKAYEATAVGERDGPRTAAQQEAALTAWDAQQASMRRILGDDRYRQLLLGSQPGGARLSSFFNERPDITVDQIMAFSRLNRSRQVDQQRAMETSSGLSNEQRRANVAALTQRYLDQATQILGPQHVQAAVAQGLLLPAGPNGAMTMPAVRLPGGG